MNEDEMKQPTQAMVIPPNMEMLKYKEELASKMGLPSPYGMTLLKDFCTDLVASGMVPSYFNNNPMAVYAAAMRGREMGLDPTEAIMETFWPAPGNRISMFSNKMIDIMHRKGVKSKFIREDKDGCEILFTPPGDHEPYTAKFELAEAVSAKLVKPDSNYQKWPSDMCKARAIARGWRALAGTFKGSANIYAKEELEDLDQDTSADDQRRVDRMTGGMGDFKVGLKVVPKAETAPETQPEPVKTVEVKAEATEPTPEPIETPKSAPVIEFWVCSISKKSGKDVPTPVEGEVPQNRQDTATLRARSLCNEKGVTFVVIKTQDGKFVEEVSICNPLSKPAPAPAAAPAPASAPTPRPVATGDPKAAAETIKARFNEFAALLDLPGKTAITRFKAFVAGYMGVSLKDLPNDPLEWMESVEELGYSLGYDPNEFRSGPESAGKLAHQRRLEILGYIEKEWKDTQTQTLALAVARKYGYRVSDFQKWAEFIGLEPKLIDGVYCSLPTKDANAFLRAFKVTREAGILPKLAKDHNLEVSAIIDQIEQRGLKCKLEESNQKDVENAIKGFALAVREEAKAAAAPTPDSPSAPVNEPSGTEPPAAEGGPEADGSGEESDEGQDNIFASLF